MDKQLLLNYIEAHKDELITLLQDMIRSKPVNPVYAKEKGYNEAACSRRILEKLQELGMIIHTFDVDLSELEIYREKPGFITGYTDKIDFKNRPNIVARLPGTDPENGRSVLLIGHSDVVAADDADEWEHDPFAAEIAEGVLYGRGTVDELGGLACMLIAIKAMIETGNRPKGDIWFASAVSEESGGTGCLAIADWLEKNGAKIDAGIMGEPTDLEISLLCRNIQWVDLTVYGRTGHLEVWQPHWTQGGAADAIDKARYIMGQIDNLNKEWALRPDKNHPLLKESCQVKVAMIEGGHHRSSFPATCKLSINIQVLPHETNEDGLGNDTRREFEEFIKQISEADPWLKRNPPKIDWICEADCSEVLQEHPFVKVFEKSTKEIRRETVLNGSGFHTDTGWLMRVPRIPVVNYGPGNPALAHRTNEKCKIEDIVTCCKGIASVCYEWCN